MFLPNFSGRFSEPQSTCPEELSEGTFLEQKIEKRAIKLSFLAKKLHVSSELSKQIATLPEDHLSGKKALMRKLLFVLFTRARNIRIFGQKLCRVFKTAIKTIRWTISGKFFFGNFIFTFVSGLGGWKFAFFAQKPGKLSKVVPDNNPRKAFLWTRNFEKNWILSDNFLDFRPKVSSRPSKLHSKCQQRRL